MCSMNIPASGSRAPLALLLGAALLPATTEVDVRGLSPPSLGSLPDIKFPDGAPVVGLKVGPPAV